MDVMRRFALSVAAVALTGCAAFGPSRSSDECPDGKPVQRPTLVTATDNAFVIIGIVKNAATLEALPGAIISVDGGARSAVTDAAGLFHLDLGRSQPLPTRLTVDARGYGSHLHAISMSANAGLRLEILMTSDRGCPAR
jgi:hypothetical protein